MLVTQARYVAPDISGVSKSRVKQVDFDDLLVVMQCIQMFPLRYL